MRIANKICIPLPGYDIRDAISFPEPFQTPPRIISVTSDHEDRQPGSDEQTPVGFIDTPSEGLLAEPPPPRSFLDAIPRWVWFTAIAVAAVVLAGNIVRVPYYSLGPGPATNVLTRMKITGVETYPTEGELLLTTASVSDRPLTVFQAAWTWFEADVSLVERERLVPPNVTDEEQELINKFQIESSKIEAEVAAFRALGRDVPRRRGARVLTIFPGGGADGKLKPGDIITAVDGKRMEGVAETGQAISSHAIGEAVRVTVRRGGESRSFTLMTRPGIGNPTAATIGVTLLPVFDLPARVEIDTSRIGGPSGGLVFALSIIEAVTEEDLTKGRVVAATGTIGEITEDGATIGEIGAVGEKIIGARAAKAEVFLVPAAEADEARAVAPEGMRVIGVKTLRDAVDALRNLPAAG